MKYSQSYLRFCEGILSGRRIREAASDRRIAPISRDYRRTFLHAALAAHVASWDSYLNSVIREFRQKTRRPLDAEYSIIHSNLEAFVDKSLLKFNTPNWENSRNILIECTGYDPINDWKWSRAGLTVTETQILLNQILKVRHSFAHGFPIPSFSWTTTPSGQHRVDARAVARIETFLSHLAKVTDLGLLTHMKITYPSCGIW